MENKESNEYLLQFFAYDHLPAHLQTISRPFHDLAWALCYGDNISESGNVTIGSGLPRNPERTTSLRKLLEAKDCAVRAVLFKWD
jgi:hypothetical protein